MRKLIAPQSLGNGAVDRGAASGLDAVMPRPVLLLLPFLLGACAGPLPFERVVLRASPGVWVVEAPGAGVLRPAARPGTAPEAAPEAAPESAHGAAPAPRQAAAAPLRPGGRTAAALDTTTEAQRRAAAVTARAAEGRALGETLASLGNPAEPGLWLETGLVDRPRPGRVVAPSGEALAVDLRPSGGPPGAGGRASLGLLRALGLPVTGLNTLRVFALD
jgi:hypothetical protein